MSAPLRLRLRPPWLSLRAGPVERTVGGNRARRVAVGEETLGNRSCLCCLGESVVVGGGGGAAVGGVVAVVCCCVALTFSCSAVCCWAWWASAPAVEAFVGGGATVADACRKLAAAALVADLPLPHSMLLALLSLTRHSPGKARALEMLS